MGRTAAIIGLGLIGGSLGIALRKAGWKVTYRDPAVPLEQARTAGAADALADQTSVVDIIVLATPVDSALTLLQHRSPGSLTTSTCGVMHPLRAAAPKDWFIAGHPFAGSERSGIEAANGELFSGKVWFVDRDDSTVKELIESAGARQVVVDAEVHDATVALTSHLPQLISTAMASLIEQKKIDPNFFGSGLRTLLRLAGSSYQIWEPVLTANRDNVDRALDELLRVAEQLDERDFDRANAFDRGRAGPR